MIKTLAGGFSGERFILAQEGRQFKLAQMMREQDLRRRDGAGGMSAARRNSRLNSLSMPAT
jgi:hypothetical protein